MTSSIPAEIKLVAPQQLGEAAAAFLLILSAFASGGDFESHDQT